MNHRTHNIMGRWLGIMVAALMLLAACAKSAEPPIATREPAPTFTPTPEIQAPAIVPAVEAEAAEEPASTQPLTEIPVQPAAVIINTQINVRGGPDTNYNIVGMANPGESYPVTGMKTDMSWWQINYDGQSGWVFGELVTAQNAQVGTVAPNITVPPFSQTPAPAEQMYAPELSAESYMLYDLSSDRVLFEHNSNAVRAPASLTKLMTALLVLEKGDLGAVVRIEPEDLVGGATMGLVAGDLVTVTDLLWGLLLPSGNDAATALARHVGGSVDDFVVTMNRRAQALGLSQTHFVNVHGLDAEGHVSSAADVLALTQALWEYPLFRSMVGTAQVQWNGHDLRNTNEWLTTFAGVTGVKTGTTDNAGECLVASVEVDGRTVLLVIMGSVARYQDAETLYDDFRSSYVGDAENRPS